MLRTSESENEILLGNKQLLGIFFVVALLLAIAFYGGYMVGHGGTAKKSTLPGATQEEAATPAATGGAETHVVPSVAGTSSDGNSNASSDVKGARESRSMAQPKQMDEPLGAPRHKASARTESTEAEPAGASATEGFAPQVGEQFLQVVAVSRDEAEAVADVLHKKGFRAHAVPKPGNSKIYRVIIGPIRDTAELSSTREALVRTGFREVILQRY